MLSGALNSENLTQTLRDISQRRRQGILSLEVNEEKFEVWFVQGRVVDVVTLGSNKIDEILVLLKRIGKVPQTLDFHDSSSYTDLFKALNADRVLVAETQFREVIKHHLLNKLYFLNEQSSGYYSFQVRMLEHDKNFAPSISVGQLLLDLVALKTDSAQFAQLFGEDPSIQRTEVEGGAFNEDEQELWDQIGQGIRFSDLQRGSYLSRFHLQEILLSFSAKGLLKLAEAQTSDESNALDLGSLSDAFDKNIDSAFGGSTAAQNSAPQAAILGEDAPLASKKVAHLPAPKRFKAKLSALNSRLLQFESMPDLVAFFLIAAALTAPFVLWGRMFDGL